MSESPFSTDFSMARTRFRNAASAAGATLSDYPYPERGPNDEPLTTDVAWLGSRDARNVLVTVSGTHGVEGFCGSGAQVEWLERFARNETRKLSADSAVMLVHVIFFMVLVPCLSLSLVSSTFLSIPSSISACVVS